MSQNIISTSSRFNRFGPDGLDSEGYDMNGHNKAGYKRNGFDVNGYDRDGFYLDGFNRDGFNVEGKDRNGNRPTLLEGKSGRGSDKKPRKPRVGTPTMRLNLRLPPDEVLWLREISSHKVSAFISRLVRSEMGKVG